MRYDFLTIVIIVRLFKAKSGTFTMYCTNADLWLKKQMHGLM